eukprot:CAMPEP_0176441674 /NCGR_PEP_ID=MMETSP0127-20121128/21348_1 /TAXON_ID=938130 /ORGANISM="Platyophrya macrostoma, Strain WH" /LENGTH=467 /DNA_ID=CAMNT_0017826517 /DNA_START=31 /DNA_END=1434 /DNA_ORIENTATION=+
MISRSNEMDIEQPMIATSDRMTEEDPKASWLTFAPKKEDEFEGTFHISKALYNEQQSMSKMLSSKKFSCKSQSKVTKKLNSDDFLMNPTNYKGNLYQPFIPNKVSYTFEGISSRLYNANFDSKGERFFVTSQSGTAIFDYTTDNKLKLNQTINCNYVSWALTDSDFTSDNKYMIHSTLSPNVQLFDAENGKYLTQLNMDTANEEDEMGFFYYSFRVYSAKISGDGRHVFAGTSRASNGKAKLQMYDVEEKKLIRSVNAHENDINSICFVDRENSSLILTGSDDGLCKLWDTRSMDNGKPVGIFYGHLSGVTYVSSKEDSRYFVSNSKDQSIKLWDIRRCKTEEKNYHHFGFDYRMEKLSNTEIGKIKKAMKANPNDDSISTFFGHQVYVSLIRCHFSPKFNTDQRYIYSGSADGSVYIYDVMTTDLVAKLEVNEDRVIRDCSWHPVNQSLITTDFAGNICKWDYTDL